MRNRSGNQPRLGSKFVLGKPADVLSNGVKWLPKALRFFLYEKLMLILNGRNRDIGLPEPDHRIPYSTPSWSTFVRHGKIRVRQAGCAAARGSHDSFYRRLEWRLQRDHRGDGYWIEHPSLNREIDDFSSAAVPLYPRMLPATQRNLYFISLFQPLGCIWIRRGVAIQAGGSTFNGTMDAARRLKRAHQTRTRASRRAAD